LLAAAADLAGPYFVKVAIDHYIQVRDMGGVAVVSALYLGTVIVGAAVRYWQNYITQIVGQQVMYELRMEVFTHLQRLAVAFFAGNPVGRLMTRITNDVDTLYEMVTSGVVTVFGDVFLLVGVVAAMVWLDWRLALVAFSVVPALVALTSWFQARSRESYRAIRIRIARINAYLNENLMGMSIVQLFNRERANAARVEDLNRDHLTAHLEAVWSFALFYPAVGFLGAVATALLIWYGGGQLAFANVWFGYPALEPADPGVAGPAGEARSAPGRGEPRVPAGTAGWVLRGVSFAIRPGESVAFVGHTGAGKTSIINLITRFY